MHPLLRNESNGEWRSPVAQRSGGPEVACSNHVSPTKRMVLNRPFLFRRISVTPPSYSLSTNGKLTSVTAFTSLPANIGRISAFLRIRSTHHSASSISANPLTRNAQPLPNTGIFCKSKSRIRNCEKLNNATSYSSSLSACSRW